MKSSLFTFTPLRVRIFVFFLVFFFVLPHFTGLIGRLPFVWVLGHVVGLAAKYFPYIPGMIFGEPLFELTEFGMEPQGFLGKTVLIIFFLATAFLLSWPGNLWKRDKA